MKIFILGFALTLLTIACGRASGDSTSKPLTVDDLRLAHSQKPDEFKTKYAGKKVVLVGKVSKLPFTFPGAYETLGYQEVVLKGDGDVRLINCQVTEAEGAKFKDVKEGDVVTVTGTVQAQEFTMDLTGCSKHSQK